MIKKVVAVYDKKIGAYDSPFTVRHTGEAIREWDMVIKDNNTKYGKNGEDFDLYHIADFDDSNGLFESFQKPHHLATGIPN